MNKGKKTIILLSGGVDSAVAAALLQKRGFALTGVFLIFGSHGLESDPVGNKCCSIEAQEAARRVAAKLAIPFYTVNVAQQFKKRVVDYFLKEYQAGRTPNPCVQCNKFIKFGLMLEKAFALGFDYVATGHYIKKVKSKKEKVKNKEKNQEMFKLFQARDQKKDQSYFLYTLNQKKLGHLLFPLRDYKKSEVRKMARQFGLPTAERRDSQGVCFVGQKHVADFLQERIKAPRGKIVEINSREIIGEHRGLPFYTIGQREGIGVGGTGPYYVVRLDFRRNVLEVTADPEDPALFGQTLIVSKVHWISGKAPACPFHCHVKIRYGHPAVKATLQNVGQNNVEANFAWPQRAITPGQAAVFYRQKELLGGGIIGESGHSQTRGKMLQ